MKNQEDSESNADQNAGRLLPADKPKSLYQAPSLIVFGKIQTIVAAGSGSMVEGMGTMMSMTRRP